MPPSETFPSDCLDAVVAFVKDGGTLVLNGGVPLYYASTIDPETGKYRQEKGNPNFNQELEKLRISWYAWWTRENTPEGMRAVTIPGGEFAVFHAPAHQTPQELGDNLRATWRYACDDWLPASTYEADPSRMAFEYYLGSSAEVYIPVRGRAK